MKDDTVRRLEALVRELDEAVPPADDAAAETGSSEAA